jgi:MFS transporter, putative metabolite:H+ symporter
MRGTAVGLAYSLSRLSGAILPFVSVTVLDSFGATAVFVGSAAIMTILSLDVGLLVPRSTGMNLEDAAAESGRPPDRRPVREPTRETSARA